MHCCTARAVSREIDTFEDLLTHALGVLQLINACLQRRLPPTSQAGTTHEHPGSSGSEIGHRRPLVAAPAHCVGCRAVGQLLSGAAVLCPENTDHLCYEMAFVCKSDTCWILNLKILLTIIFFLNKRDHNFFIKHRIWILCLDIYALPHPECLLNHANAVLIVCVGESVHCDFASEVVLPVFS